MKILQKIEYISDVNDVEVGSTCFEHKIDRNEQHQKQQRITTLSAAAAAAAVVVPPLLKRKNEKRKHEKSIVQTNT